ncbi:MAG: RNA polymerase sigma factor SigZ [Flavobacteriales bacterium]
MQLTTEQIWNEFHDKLHGFILKRVHDTEVANDLLQDIFVKIHTKINTLKQEDKLTSWIYQVTRNSILDYFKTKKPSSSLPADLTETTEPKTFNQEMENCLKSMLNELPPEHKDAILQTELGTLSQKEYAEKIGISYSGAKSRVQRARQELNDLFKSCCRTSFDKYGNAISHQCVNENCDCQKESASFLP